MALLKIPELSGAGERQDAVDQLDPSRTFGNKVGQEAAPLATPDWLAPKSLIDGSEAAAGWGAIAQGANKMSDAIFNEDNRQKALKKAEDHARLQETKLDFQIAADKLKEEVSKGVRTVANADGSTTLIKLHDGDWNTDQKNEYFTDELSKLKDSKFFNGQFDLSDPEIQRNRDLHSKDAEWHATSNWKKTVIEPERVATVSAIIERTTQSYKEQAYNATSLDDLKKIQAEAADFITQPYAMGVLSPEQLNHKMMTLKSEMASVFVARALDGMNETNYQQKYLENKALIENTKLLEDLTPEERLKKHDQNEQLKTNIEHQIEAKKAKAEAEAKKAQSEYHKKNTMTLYFDIESGKATSTDVLRAFQKGRISFEEFKSLDHQYKTNLNKEDGVYKSYDIVTTVASNNGKHSNQKEVDGWWKVTEATIAQRAPEERFAAVVQAVKKVGVVPTQLKTELENGAISDSPEKVQATIFFLRQLKANDPAKLSQLNPETRNLAESDAGGKSVTQIMEGRDARLKASDSTQALRKANLADYLHTEKGKRVPEPVEAVLKTIVTPEGKSLKYSEVDDELTGIATNYFKRYVLEGYTKDQAIKLAASDFNNKVGVNTVGAGSRLMINPPHLVYKQDPPIINKQFSADMVSLGKDPAKVSLGEIITSKNGVPAYQLMAPNDQGIRRVLKNEKNEDQVWAFDANAHLAAAQTEQTAELEKARYERERGQLLDPVRRKLAKSAADAAAETKPEASALASVINRNIKEPAAAFGKLFKKPQ